MVSFSGTSLPFAMYGGAVVPYMNSFIIVGGKDWNDGDQIDYDTIIKYNIEDQSWKMLPKRLIQPRHDLSAMMISEC